MKIQPQSGFTIIELVLTVLIAATLLTIGVSNFQSFVTSNRLTTQSNTMVAALQYARSEAIKQRRTITVAAADKDHWENGWRIWVDKDGSGGTAPDAGEPVLRVQDAMPGGNQIKGNSAYIQYLPTGFIALDPAAASNTLSVDVCHKSGVAGRQVTVALTGRVATNGSYTCP